MIRRRLIITGRVQGVYYRAWFGGQMRAIGITGWVRNRADGSVEAVVEGPAEMVEQAIVLARQGSPAARVDTVSITDDAPSETLDGFAQRASI